jgi:undecaprenyl-diphosphatase
LATFFFTTLKPWIGNKAWLFYCWAGIIIYAQVYVGVHYPLDVISGGILGTFIGGLTSLAFNKQYKLA